MNKKVLCRGLIIGFAASLLAVNLGAQEKARWGVHFKADPYYGIATFAAEQQGFFKEQGLEVERIDFRSAGFMVRALAANSVDVGTHGMGSVPISVASGVPEVIVADPGMSVDFVLWSQTDSPFKKPEDMKGGTIGVSRMGTTPHRLSLIALEKLGLSGQVKIISVGGGRPLIAAMKARKIDFVSLTNFSLIPLQAMGEARIFLNLSKLLPEAPNAQIIFAHTGYLKNHPENVRKAVRGFLRGGAFVMKNQDWAVKRIMSFNKFTESAAKIAFQNFRFSSDARIDVNKVKAAIEFDVKTGLIPPEKAPPVEKVYVEGFAD